MKYVSNSHDPPLRTMRSRNGGSGMNPCFCVLLYLFLVLHSKNSTWQLRDVVNEMTATETGQFRLPSQLDVNSGNMSETSNGGNGKWKCT